MGRFAPQFPTDGRELMAAWELPQSAWDTESVKVGRCVIGTNRVTLLHSEPIRDFSMARCSGEYGPGKYRISPGPGPYSSKQVTLEIDEVYARREGWGQAPATPALPSSHELMAAQTFQKAQAGPVDRLELMAMIETAIQRSQPPAPALDPITLMMKGFELSNTFQAKSLDLAKSMLGVNTPAEAAPRTMADVLVEMGPSILETIQKIVPAIAGAVASSNARAAATQPPPPPPHRPAPALATNGAEPMSRELAPVVHTEPPPLTQEEIAAISPIVAVMKPYAGILAQQLTTAPPEELAQQLSGLLGPELDESILALDSVCLKHSPAVLLHIGPGLGTAGAALVVHELARIIGMQQGEGQDE